MRYEQHVDGVLQGVQCDICATCTIVGAVIDEQEFDPRSRATGPPPHPFLEGQHACYKCMKAGKHLGGRSVRPAGMLVAKVYDVLRCSRCLGRGVVEDTNLHDSARCDACAGHGKLFLDDSREDRDQNGLRLPEKPYTDAEWERFVCCGLLLHPTRSDRALLCTMRDYWWCPAYVFDGSQLASTLAQKDAAVLFVEPSKRTPFRTVYEATLASDLDAAAVFAYYGAEAAERIREHDALEVALRVPMEILQ